MAAQGSNARRGSAALAEVRATPLERVKTTAVEIDGEVVQVGKLGLNQLVALARVAGQTVAKGQQDGDLRQAAERTVEGESAGGSDISNITLLLGLLDEPTVCGLVGIIVQRDEEWVGAHVDALALVEILDAVLEHNDWKQLQTAFFRLGRRFQSASS